MTSVSIGFSSDRFNELSDVVLSSHTLHTRCATNRYFQVLGNIHDIESYFGIDNVASFSSSVIFNSHYGHTSIILLWVSSSLFHVGWMGNYSLFTQNPIKTIPIAHGIFDPHFGSHLTATATTIAYSGIYNWLYTLGFTSVAHIYNFVITCELLAVISILNAFMLRLHKNYVFSKFISYLGFLSIGWCGHLVHLTRAALTFFGGLKPDTMSLYLTDIAHHHLAVGILFVLLTHLYSSLNRSSLDVLAASTIILKRSALNKSLDLQLSLACAVAGYMASVVAQHTYSLTPYQYLSYHYVTTLALYVHHQYIASFLMMAVLSHATIYLIRDYTVVSPASTIPVIAQSIRPTISHLSWICLYLGFHSLLVF
eukprot:TRINITY_DN12615_c0_g1_i3.p1 TRINITY_DN12615_c0_g1~~TRINITY_DN12615_c0_g1_i3.p1  ORF type:complete len:384 (-),score=-127.92 TRINITY_DN12615_c0_g1_i3:866-1969(-)